MKINVIYNSELTAILRIIVLILACCTHGKITAQESSGSLSLGEFQGQVILGVNFSQLDGDQLSGFDKLGIRAGFDILYPVNDNKSISLGILFDQKGSSNGLFNGASRQYIALDYISLPISFQFHNWWFSEYDHHKIRLYGSVIPSRLLSTRSNQSNFDQANDLFKKWDLSLAAGVGYFVSKRSSIHLRIERSLLKIYKVPNATITGLQSYLTTVQFNYLLNKLS